MSNRNRNRNHNRKPPVDSVQGPGEVVVGISQDYAFVALQFTDPDWWVHFTPDEARNVARLLVKKADDIERTRQGSGEN